MGLSRTLIVGWIGIAALVWGILLRVQASWAPKAGVLEDPISAATCMQQEGNAVSRSKDKVPNGHEQMQASPHHAPSLCGCSG